MNNLVVLCEGEAEIRFVSDVLAPHLAAYEVFAHPMGLGSGVRPGYSFEWEGAVWEIIAKLREPWQPWVTTLVDYYALPPTWPGRSDSASKSPDERGPWIESKLAEDVAARLGDRGNESKFIPYVHMHELESLLFSNPATAALSLGHPELEPWMQGVVEECGGAERINDRFETKPSRRLALRYKEDGWPKFKKVLHGIPALCAISLESMRDKCPHFGAWLSRLEDLGQASESPPTF
jgi:hypothetical protein